MSREFLGITYPGEWLAVDDQEANQRTRTALLLLEHELVDLVVALRLFEPTLQERQQLHGTDGLRSVSLYFDPMICRPPDLFARLFLDAAARYRAILSTNLEAVAFAEALSDLDAKFPLLKDMRDSATHVEDRGRGVDRRGSLIEAQPIVTPSVKITAQHFVILGELQSDGTLTYTTEKGEHGQLRVCAETADSVIANFQGLIDRLNWKVPPSRFDPLVGRS